MAQKNDLGKGVHFPPRIDDQGRWACSVGEENIRQSIQLVLGTEPLERIMLPKFGCGLKRMLSKLKHVATHRLIEEVIARALERLEPRIALDSVVVAVDQAASDVALVTVRYTVVATKRENQMQLRLGLERRPI